MSVFQINHCPVCGSNRFASFMVTTDHFISGETFEIQQCTACGMKFTTGAKDEDQIGRYYRSEEYISHSNTDKGMVNAAYHLVRRFMLGQKRKLVERVSGVKKGHLLDVGTGTGFFLNEMKLHGWQVSGTEKSEEARNFAQKKFELILHPAEELFLYKENQFDVVTLWHVLEHIHRLNESMVRLFRLLKKEGKLIIALPNNSSFDAHKYGKYWAAWDVPRHLWHFSPRQVKLLGEKHGFRLQSMHNMPFDSFYVSMLSEKYRKSKFPLFGGMLYGMLSWLISLTKKGRGSSVIYVFVKNR